MPKLVLKFDDRVLEECFIGHRPVKIGRLPDNTIVIDNPAVSSHHARVVPEGGSFVLEDLQSTNGTFVNEKPITRHTLHDGDVVLIGKHKIEFDLLADDQAPAADAAEAGPAVPDLGGTRLLDTQDHKALLAKWEKDALAKKAGTGGGAATPPPAVQPAAVQPPAVRPPAAQTPAASAPATERPVAQKTERAVPPARIGVLRVLAGNADQAEYNLTAHTALVGKADTALVRLKGWFKPKVAVAIARKGDDYAATPLGGKTLINGRRLSARQELRDGDVLEVSGLTLEFRLK